MRVSHVSDWGFLLLVYDKIYLETQINKKYIWLKNNTAQLYFIFGTQFHYFSFNVVFWVVFGAQKENIDTILSPTQMSYLVMVYLRTQPWLLRTT